MQRGLVVGGVEGIWTCKSASRRAGRDTWACRLVGRSRVPMARLIGQDGNCSRDRVAQMKGRQDQPRSFRRVASSGLHPREWPPLGGHSCLVVPITVTFDDYRSVAIMVIPAAMPTAIMFVDPNARAAIVVITVAIVIIPVAADAEAVTLRAR